MNNQTELRSQILTKLREFGVSGGRFEERTDYIMGLLTSYITANCTPNSEVAERERLARLDELDCMPMRYREYWKPRIAELSKGASQLPTPPEASV